MRTIIPFALLSLLLPISGWAQKMQEIRGVAQLPQVLPLDDQGYAVMYRNEAGEDGQDIFALRLLDPTDPVKYDFALFGLGVEAKL